MVSKLVEGSPISEASIRVTVSVEGAKSQEWETATGGAQSAPITKVRKGYSPNKVAVVPAVTDAADVTVTRQMVVADVWAYQAYLLSLVGIGSVKVWKTPMDALGASDYAAAKDVQSLVYEGIIQSVDTVGANNESTSVAMISMTISGTGWQPAA